MTVREKIIQFMEEKDYSPMTKKTLANKFNIGKPGLKAFYDILESLEKEGRIIKINEDKYNLIDNDYLIVGRLEGHERGFGFVVPEDKERGADIFIPRDYMNGAMHGDTVIANIISEATESRREEGEILRILERRDNKIVGIFDDNKSFGFVIPDDNKIGYDIFIPKAQFGKAKSNQKVVVEITKWPKNGRNPEGRVVEVLGYLSEAGTDILSIIRQFDLPEKFPKEVTNYVDNINQEVTKEEIKSRVDLRDLKTFTIDGFDAKDLDDAISIHKKDNGNYDLGVHIADVSHYVQENSILDKEAENRGNSVYLLDRVIPMLPEELSNGICSLNPNQDRLCLSVTMEIDKSGTVIDHRIEETVINSKHRLIYDDVSDYLELETAESIDKLKDVLEELTLMKELSKILRAKRERRGSIDFNFPETTIILDEKGIPVEVREEERRIGNKIIEEFMLITNETVSEHYFWADVPFLYRIHEDPSPERIADFNKIIYNFGYSIKGEQEIHPKELQLLMKEIEGKDEESLISILMLRSLKKAIYSEVPGTHFGLASKYYSHFTAPIRRYPDLIIHRIIKMFINGKLSNNKIDKLIKDLPEIADHSSMTERRAEEAEREVDDMKKAEYMQKYIGYEFKGRISSLTNFGIFVQLENTIEGLVHFSTLKDDYYEFDEENYYVIGERTKNIYRLGQEVIVRVMDANVAKRVIDFRLIELDEY